MVYHTWDSFMDQWLNRLMRCDKSWLNCGAGVMHLSLQALDPWNESSLELFDINQLFQQRRTF